MGTPLHDAGSLMFDPDTTPFASLYLGGRVGKRREDAPVGEFESGARHCPRLGCAAPRRQIARETRRKLRHPKDVTIGAIRRMTRTRTSRVIKARPEDIYRAFMDPGVLVAWLPPAGMTGVTHAFDARVGGGYRMSLFYPANERTFRGKTSEREDRVDVRFVELVPPRRIVETVSFVTTDPAFFGEMMMTATFDPLAGGTDVTLVFENLPTGLRAEDNAAGAQSSLEQLARRFE